MPIYHLRCTSGECAAPGRDFEAIQSFTAPLPACPACGAPTRKIPATFGIGGLAARALPPPAERMPQTWRGTYNANREYVTELRRTAERRREMEQRHPELAADRRPVLAHEGRYAAAPLRKGDPVPGPAPHSHPHPGGEA